MLWKGKVAGGKRKVVKGGKGNCCRGVAGGRGASDEKEAQPIVAEVFNPGT